MELNFNSVETIPNLNASAAFQVDSGKVFKEDVDMVPTIIDKSLSYMPWGGDNMMPYNILNLIEDNEPSARQSLQHESLRQRGVRIANLCQTVGKILLDILDLLKTASSDTERQVLDDWKNLLSQHTVVYDVAHATGMADMEHMFLTLKGRSQYSTWLRRWLA